MTVYVSNYVWRNSLAKGSALLVLLALADEANNEGDIPHYRRSVRKLAWKINASENAVRRAITTLVDDGELEITDQGGGGTIANYRIVGLPPYEEGGKPHATKKRTPAELAPLPNRDPSQDGSPTPPAMEAPIPLTGFSRSFPTPDDLPIAVPAADLASKALADKIARRVWEAKTPRPVTPFVAVRKLVTRFLEAGHAEESIAVAMIAAPTISIGAVELQLNRGRPAPRRQVIDSDRGGPAGVVDASEL